MNRKQMTEDQVSEAVRSFSEKLQFRLQQKGWGTFSSSHEILGAITEEYHELVDAVKSNNSVNIREELLDIAVGAVFGAACIDEGTVDWP